MYPGAKESNGMIISQTTDLDVNPETGEVLEPSASLINSGSVVCLRMPEQGGAFAVETQGRTPGGGAVRGVIRGRSEASRRRFQQSMGRVNLTGVSGVMLLTLTWSEVPGHADQQRFLDNFIKWIMRRFHGAPVAWAKERGKVGGRWHFHLVVFGSDWVTCRLYQAAWNRIAGRFAGNVDVAFKQDAAVVRYLAKYLSKEVGVWQDAPARGGIEADEGALGTARAVDLGTTHISPQETHTGRTWGWRNYEKLPLHPVIRRKIPLSAAHKVRRCLAGIQKAELRGRVTQWKAWTASFDPDFTGAVCAPDWIRVSARKEKVHPGAYCAAHLEAAEREYVRFLRRGSHLARGSYDRRGWSCFVQGDGGPLLERLNAYLEGDSWLSLTN